MPVPSAEMSDLTLVVAQDLVQPGAFGIEDLAAQRQDGLEVAVAALFG